MKLIKIILAIVMAFGMMIAQPPTQGGNQGPPPCDQWLNSNMAHDMNGDGTVDENDCPQQGPDPFQQAFMTTMQNGGTPDEGFEAVAAVFHQMEVECPDCEMTEEEFQEGKAEAKAAFDAVLADGGTPQEAFHAAMEAGNDGGDQGPPTCDVCGYTFAGEGDHHGHCDKCDFVFTSDNDQHGHCDQCDYIFSGEGDQHGHCDKCDHIYSGDDEDRHGHCDHEGCDFVGNSDADWQNHHHDDGGGDHEGGDGDHDGGPPPNNHWDGNCGAMMHGESEYWLDSDGDGSPDDGPYAVWHEDADGNPVNCGGPGGPPPTCAEVDTNGDGSIDREEARAKFGHDPQGNPNPNFDQEYDEVDANGDGVVDCAEHDAAVAEGQNNN
jgi:hypothetical protein